MYDKGKIITGVIIALLLLTFPLIYLAAKEAGDTAYELEHMGEKGNMSKASDTFAALNRECERVRDFIENGSWEREGLE